MVEEERIESKVIQIQIQNHRGSGHLEAPVRSALEAVTGSPSQQKRPPTDRRKMFWQDFISRTREGKCVAAYDVSTLTIFSSFCNDFGVCRLLGRMVVIWHLRCVLKLTKLSMSLVLFRQFIVKRRCILERMCSLDARGGGWPQFFTLLPQGGADPLPRRALCALRERKTFSFQPQRKSRNRK